MSTRTDHALGLYLEGIRDGNAKQALDDHVGERYVQHSTGVADGKEGFLEFFEPFLERNPDRDIRVVRVLDDGRFVFVHVEQTLNGTARWITTDLFDTDDEGRVVEHWDVIAEGGRTTPSGHTQTDGPVEIYDLHLTEQNKQLVAAFADVVLVGGDFGRVTDFITSSHYVQHNPDVADGIDGFAAYATALAAEGRPMTYRAVHQLVGPGTFVAVLSEVDLGGDAMAVFDLFRIADGRIVEHWDNMEPVPDSGDARNGGKF